MSSVSQTTLSGDVLRFRYYDMYISTRIADWRAPLFENDPAPGQALAYFICVVALPIFLAIGLGDAIFTIIAWPVTWIMNKIYYHTQGNEPRTKAKPTQELIEAEPQAVQLFELPVQTQLSAQIEQEPGMTLRGALGHITSRINRLFGKQRN